MNSKVMWRKVSGVNAWQADDGRVIVKTARRRMGRNGWRAAGYELFASVNGHSVGFFTRLSDAKSVPAVHFYVFDQCRTACGIADTDLTSGELETSVGARVTCGPCRSDINLH